MVLVVYPGEKYPIGTQEDVEIHFMHYANCQEAKEARDKREARINWDEIIVIGTDRDGFDNAAYAQWKQSPYPKILFTAIRNLRRMPFVFLNMLQMGKLGI